MDLQFKGTTRNILLGVGFLFVIFLLWYFSTIVTYILISVVLSFIGKPLVRWISLIRIGRFKIPRGAAAFITLILLLTVLISFVRFIIPFLLYELNILSQIDINHVVNSLGEPIIQFLQSFSKQRVTFENQNFYDIFLENLAGKINFSKLSNLFALIAGTVGELLIGFFSVSFITFFFMKDENMFRDVIILLVPTSMEIKVAHILDSISHLLRRYFIGLIFEVLMVMLLVTIGLTIVGIGINHAVVIGLICGTFNIIPYLGPWLGSAFGLLIAATLNINSDLMNHTLPLLGYMTLVFATVQLIDNILFQPLIYSSSVKAHPLEIFIVLLAAGSMAGVTGMILAIPTYTILRVIAKEFFDNMKIVKKLTENLEFEEEKRNYFKQTTKNKEIIS
jgi:predicted PurR-regulated permease PerM